MLARLARGDVNMPDFDGFPIHVQVSEVKFEAEVYKLLLFEPRILASRLLYCRVPLQHVGPRLDHPQDIAGRRLLVFERAEGENNVWFDLRPEQKVRHCVNSLAVPFTYRCIKASLLVQAAQTRASLFNFQLPISFANAWLRERLFEQKPKSIPVPVAPTRDFCVALVTAKIEATIGNIGDMIGWESDGNVVGPMAAAAKQSLLRIVPQILPKADEDETSPYRLVLEHGDFGIHNMSIATDANGQPLVTSIYDWETGCVISAILSDPLMAVAVDLVTDDHASPSITRVPDDATTEDRTQYMEWSRQYFEVRLTARELSWTMIHSFNHLFFADALYTGT